MSTNRMDPILTRVFSEYVAKNRGRDGKPFRYGVEASYLGAPNDGRFAVRLTFMSGERYCCAEPRDHMWIHWSRLRAILERHGVPNAALLEVVLTGVVEQGVLLDDTGPVRQAYDYVHVYHEDEGKDARLRHLAMDAPDTHH